ncbi:hypothetical protein MVEN_02570100 [Mycena venus]|uniref:Chromo domain-containing protein n=1 Tax=Mycena venus TaxID=2733690 RepID=A0A8H6U314_9AGAR|nr:hypothetical protein MVEN_02570100 [Mycena venus]
MYHPKTDKNTINILSARVALKRGALRWEYRVKWGNLDDEESWVPISYFFEFGEMLEIDAFWTRAGLVDWRSAETLTIGQEARPQTSHTPSRGATTSQTPPLLPLELKTLIAEQAPRATLANFCATSREEYLHMMPILYRSIVQDARTGETEHLRPLVFLLFTLASTEYRHNLGPHPAALVRELRLRCSVKLPSWLEEVLQKALRCTADYALDGKSQLRTLHLDADEITISPLLSEQPAFENLADLSVARSCSNISEFEFLQIPGLKSLAYEERTPFRGKERMKMGRFFRSLQLLPTISPGLTILKVVIMWDDTHICLLEEVVNSLRLPCLEVASIKVDLWDDSLDPNFKPFLEAHPTLYDVSVILGSQPLCDDALPLLRKFAGRADDFLKVCDGARPIRDLAVTLFLPDYNEGPVSERGRAVVAALTKTPNLRRLAIVNGYDAVYDASSESYNNGMHMHGVDHSTICAIAQACSGITHLELHLKSAKKADIKALANLHELQWIRAHFWITVPNGGGPAASMYDEDLLDTNGSEDESEDENDHGSGPYPFYDHEGQTKLLLRVFRNHIDLHLLPIAPKLLEVEVEVVVAREQDPDSEHFDKRRIYLCQDFSLRIVHREGKRLTVQT